MRFPTGSGFRPASDRFFSLAGRRAILSPRRAPADCRDRRVLYTAESRMSVAYPTLCTLGGCSGRDPHERTSGDSGRWDRSRRYQEAAEGGLARKVFGAPLLCPGSGGKRIAPLDGRPDQGPARLRRKARLLFHARRRRGERFVLDRLAEPARIVLEAEMVEPRLVIDSLGQLHEEGEILGLQVQPPAGAAEVEALVLAQLARVVLAHVT